MHHNSVVVHWNSQWSVAFFLFVLHWLRQCSKTVLLLRSSILLCTAGRRPAKQNEGDCGGLWVAAKMQQVYHLLHDTTKCSNTTTGVPPVVDLCTTTYGCGAIMQQVCHLLLCCIGYANAAIPQQVYHLLWTCAPQPTVVVQ